MAAVSPACLLCSFITPASCGCLPAGFVFDMFFPPNYPSVPPKVREAAEVLVMLQQQSWQLCWLQQCMLEQCMLCVCVHASHRSISHAASTQSMLVILQWPRSWQLSVLFQLTMLCDKCCVCTAVLHVQVNLVTTGNGSVRFNPSECCQGLCSCST
jgi:hypothetical protein